jgi:hypothetical protein
VGKGTVAEGGVGGCVANGGGVATGSAVSLASDAEDSGGWDAEGHQRLRVALRHLLERAKHLQQLALQNDSM